MSSCKVPCAVCRYLFVVIFAFILVAPCALCQTDQSPDQNPPATGQAEDDSPEESFQQIFERAKSGDSEAQLQLSHAYRQGIETAPDEKEADYWLRKSAENGNTSAELELADSYAKKEDFAEAFSWFLRAAKAGDPLGQRRTAELYLDGKGTGKDYEQAMHWFKEAAAQHDAQAMLDVGNMYQNGMGVLRDDVTALKWFRLASEGGNSFANVKIGVLYMRGHLGQKDYIEAKHWFELASEEDLPSAHVGLAFCYMNGPPELKNLEKAMPLLEKAIHEGYSDPVITTLLAQMYLSDELPKYTRNVARAKELLKPLAEEGQARAEYLMGNAEVQSGNNKSAEQWYLKAAEQNQPRAFFGLAELYSKFPGEMRNSEKAAKLYIRANDLSMEADIANDASWFFATCVDTKYRNPELALKYALKAVDQSDGNVANYLDTLAEAYFVNGQYKDALATEERALALTPNNQEYKTLIKKFREAFEASKSVSITEPPK